MAPSESNASTIWLTRRFQWIDGDRGRSRPHWPPAAPVADFRTMHRDASMWIRSVCVTADVLSGWGRPAIGRTISRRVHTHRWHRDPTRQHTATNPIDHVATTLYDDTMTITRIRGVALGSLAQMRPHRARVAGGSHADVHLSNTLMSAGRWTDDSIWSLQTPSRPLRSTDPILLLAHASDKHVRPLDGRTARSIRSRSCRQRMTTEMSSPLRPPIECDSAVADWARSSVSVGA